MSTALLERVQAMAANKRGPNPMAAAVARCLLDLQNEHKQEHEVWLVLTRRLGTLPESDRERALDVIEGLVK